MGVISSLKVQLKEIQNVYDQTIKSVKMLNSGTDSLDSILNSGHNGSSKYGLGFDALTRGVKITPEKNVPQIMLLLEMEPRFIAKGNIDKFTDKNNQVFMSGRREADNCYHWSSNGSNICHLTKTDQTWLWHRKLGHISLRSLDKVVRNEAVVGIPSLDINEKFFCDDCQVGKQTKTSHRRLKECYTIIVLELLHLDLMGSMQTESLGEKKYVLVVADDYSRFT
ncbi:gag-pol polyprotein [Cucumis melo var. makuwa]|uniref:Gag-pol polyprotein n=1 Tax=Cucumis melo var. makuwa TaxID=1194695 RepID=A0A5D3BKN4_CUCMM|nr:gag-pol polyprotein [Cucumis melo var. makuwa]